MDRADLISILRKILSADENLDFLQMLDESELIKLVKLVREKIGSQKGLH